MINIYLIILSTITFILSHKIVKEAKEEKQIKKYIEKILPIFLSFNIAALFNEVLVAVFIAILSYILLQINIKNTKKFVVISATLTATTLISQNMEFYYFTLIATFLTGTNSYLQSNYKNLWIETVLFALTTILIYSTLYIAL
ncbi:MAG: hypothetical protein ACMXX7_01630 [Candidatus Woesearchaeota archaeon]